MNSDFRVSVTFPNHRKTRRLAKQHGYEAVLCLLRLFAYTSQHKPDGYLVGMSDTDISDECQWDTGNFAAILREIGYLDGEPGDCSVHDWKEHNPYAAGYAERAAIASVAAKAKHAKMTPEARSEHARMMAASRRTKNEPACTEQDNSLHEASKMPAQDDIPQAKHLARKQNSLPLPSDSDSVSDSSTDSKDSGAIAPDKPKRQSPPSNWVGYYIDRFKENADGREPILGDKERGLLKTFALKCQKIETYAEALDGFFCDSWASHNGYTVECLAGQQPDRWLPKKIRDKSNGYANGHKPISEKTDAECGISKLVPGEELKYLRKYAQ